MTNGLILPCLMEKRAACFSAKEQAVLERVLKSGAAKAVTDSKQLYRQGWNGEWNRSAFRLTRRWRDIC